MIDHPRVQRFLDAAIEKFELELSIDHGKDADIRFRAQLAATIYSGFAQDVIEQLNSLPMSDAHRAKIDADAITSAVKTADAIIAKVRGTC